MYVTVASALPSAVFWSLHFKTCLKSTWCLEQRCSRHFKTEVTDVKEAAQEEETWCEVLSLLRECFAFSDTPGW